MRRAFVVITLLYFNSPNHSGRSDLPQCQFVVPPSMPCSIDTALVKRLEERIMPYRTTPLFSLDPVEQALAEHPASRQQ